MNLTTKPKQQAVINYHKQNQHNHYKITKATQTHLKATLTKQIISTNQNQAKSNVFNYPNKQHKKYNKQQYKHKVKQTVK